MANLFNKKVLKNSLEKHNIPDEKEKFNRIRKWKKNLKRNKNINEEELQAAFLKGIFGYILGYSGRMEVDENEFTMKIEPATEVDATKPDGSLGFFYNNKEDQTRAVIELKAPSVSLDKKQKRQNKVYGTPVEQAFSYATKYDGCKWVIVSNMIEIRLYKYDRGQGHYEEFLIPELINKENFNKFHLLLCRESLIKKEGTSLTEKLTRKTRELEEDITKEFYNVYKQTRINLFEHLKKYNPDYEQEILFEKAQKFLDRIIFICFCEDLGLLPEKILHKAIERGKTSYSMSDTKVWDEIRGIFLAIDKGNPEHNINAYNGGLFKNDEILNQLIIKNDFFGEIDAISAYDFDSELDVNILGHIFEQSITDIEEIKADIKSQEYNEQKSRRKKEGIFYTPEYITKYIVENSVGKFLDDVKEELGYEELPEIDPEASPQVKGRYKKKHLKFYNKYEKRLHEIKILDPACGSGAFLNQAFDYLYKENKWIQDQKALIEVDQTYAQYRDIPLKQILQDNLYGVDLNQESVEITKLSLWLKSANKNKQLANLDDNIKCGNSLIDDPDIAGDKAFDWEEEFPEIMAKGGFDVVIGNPPYVNISNILDKKIRGYLKNNFETAKNKSDLYSFFVETGTKLLKNNGFLGFIFSNSWMGTSSFSKFRKFLIYNTQIYSLVELPPDVFEDATVTTILMFLRKNIVGKDHKIKLFEFKQNSYIKMKHELSYERIINSPNFTLSFEPEIKPHTETIKLGDIAKFSLGIKTSNDKRFILNKKKDEDCYLVLRGKNISRYYLETPTEWIWYKPKLMLEKVGAGPRKLKYFITPKKILFQGISGGHIKATIDINKYLTNDKIHILYKLDKNFYFEFILCIVNSKFMDRWLISNFNKLLEIKINQLKHLPIPKIKPEQQLPFVHNASKILNSKQVLHEKSKIGFIDFIKKYSGKSGSFLNNIVKNSQFFNQIYTGRAKKVRKLTVSINDNILTIYADKSGAGKYELFKFQEDEELKRKYIQLYLENLTDEQLE
ncbi:MAG: N-6 DNA methylase, partial [Candidatus Cloacimonetes bacterium]|nr:N-6 DNA methylase [Candidatus Cloacimonadota bacterium]